MRILFASGSWEGGARRSADELTKRLAQRGHEVAHVVGRSRRGPLGQLHRRLTNAAVRYDGRWLAKPFDLIRRRIGRRLRLETRDSLPTFSALAPENAIPDLVHRLRPDVVVVSGLNLQPWRTIGAHLREAGVPSVLYMREENALRNLTSPKAVTPDLLVANTRSFAEVAETLGRRCEWVPSVVELAASRVESSRRVALLVNPIPSHGVDIALAVADARPDIPVALQESWHLGVLERRRLLDLVDDRPNVEFRPLKSTPMEVYADARVLLVPHRLDNRPRMIAESLANAIPAVVADWPGLIDAAGPGAIVVPRHAPAPAWIDAVSSLWDDDDHARRVGDAGRRWVERDEMEPEHVVTRFEHLLVELVGRTP